MRLILFYGEEEKLISKILPKEWMTISKYRIEWMRRVIKNLEQG